MNKFTLENTKDATHLYSATQFQQVIGHKHHYMNAATNFKWVYCSNQAFVEGLYFVELSRPHNETRDHWTTNGVTQYAQPQGNDIDWILGSEYYKPSTKEFFRMPSSGNYAEYYSQKHQAWRVSAMAPVSNLTRSYFIKRTEWPSCDSQENIDPGVDYAESQKAKAKPLDVSGLGSEPHPLQGLKNLGAKPLNLFASEQLDFINAGQAAIKTLKSLGYEYKGAEYWKPPIGKAPDYIEPPTFTQAMADAGELPAVGSDILYTAIEHQSGKPSIEVGAWYHGTVVAYSDGFVWTSDNGLRMLRNTTFKPIQTAEEKLKAALMDSIKWNSTWEYNVDELMNSDKFTITLKG